MAEIPGAKEDKAPASGYKSSPLGAAAPATPEPVAEPELAPGPRGPTPASAGGASYKSLPVMTKSEFREQAETAGKSFVGGATRFSGAAAGAGIGIAAGAATGPFAPLAVPVLGTVGLVGGYFAGDLATSGLDELGLAEESVETLPPHLRPTGIFFEALGAGATLTGQTMGFANLSGRLPETAVGRVVNGILDMARDKPMQFLAAELPPLVAGAGAEAVFEAARPDHPFERTAVGVAAGILNPARLIAKYTGAVYKGLKTVAQRMSPEGRLTKAGENLTKFLAAADQAENPEVLLKALRDADLIGQSIPGFRGTAAQTTGDIRLAQLEAELAEHDRKFGEQARDMANESLEAISNAISLLRGTGDQFALRAAAELQQVRGQMAIDRLLLHAQQDAVEAAEKIPMGLGQLQRAEMSAEVSSAIYERALTRARDVEEAMWGEAMQEFGDTPALVVSVRRTFSSLKSEESAIKVPAAVERKITDFANASAVLNRWRQGVKELPDGSKITAAMVKKAEKEMSVGSLHRFRSDMLTLARGQGRSTDPASDKLARWYGLMASAALNDMTRAGAVTMTTAQEGVRRGVGGRFGAQKTSLDEAREFTKQVSDTFERSFVGAAQQQGAYGLRVPPETLLKRAFASGEELAVLQMKELEDAVRFLPPGRFQNPGVLAEVAYDTAFVMDAQARLLHIMAGRVVKEVSDPETGTTFLQTDLKAARNFLAKNQQLLEKFPSVKQSLETAVESKERLDNWALQLQGAKRINDESALGALLKVEDPVAAIRGALSGPVPLQRLEEMAQIANSGGQAAQDGFRAAIFEHVMAKARTPDNRLGLQRMVDGLHEPVFPGGPSLRQFMEKEGFLPPEAAKRLDDLVDAATRVMTAVEARAVGEAVLDPASAIETLLVRATGSEIGRRMLRTVQPEGAGASGPTLIVAYQAAKAAQDLVNRMPQMAVQKLIVDALKGEPLEPATGLFKRAAAAVGMGKGTPGGGKRWSLLEKLMNPGETPHEQMVSYEQLHAYMWQAGLLGAEDQFELQNRGPVADPATPSGYKQQSLAPASEAPEPASEPASEPAPAGDQGAAIIPEEGSVAQQVPETPTDGQGAPEGQVPRGERNNNPGNLRRSGDKWDGLSDEQNDEAFFQFDTPEAGIRAMGKVLLNYQKIHKLKTVEKIINRWAPGSENDTESYVASVSRQLGVSPKEKLNLAGDRNVLQDLIEAIIHHENGRVAYPERVIAAGVDAAIKG